MGSVRPGGSDDQAEDAAWRAIVENYGERALLDDEAPEPEASEPVEEPIEVPNVPEPVEDPEDTFVPPEPPPLPRPRKDRLLAWIGVLGSPVVLLVALLLGLPFPTWLAYGLVIAFVGGFGYLVVRMPREPRDPWDDGARL